MAQKIQKNDPHGILIDAVFILLIIQHGTDHIFHEVLNCLILSQSEHQIMGDRSLTHIHNFNVIMPMGREIDEPAVRAHRNQASLLQETVTINFKCIFLQQLLHARKSFCLRCQQIQVQQHFLLCHQDSLDILQPIPHP